MNNKLTDVVLICTRNRPDDLRRALATVLTQSRLPTGVLIVDSSDDQHSEMVVREANESPANPLEIQYVHTIRGLTRQRNVGLRLVGRAFDVVHFIDDDVELEPDYTRELISAFEESPQLVGAGGLVIDSQNPTRHRALKYIGRSSQRPGIVLRTGVNTGAHHESQPLDVDWLPGCSMSFKLEKIRGLEFDENRDGYALGEDVDFGLKARARGALAHVPTARLVHHYSPVDRHDRRALERMGTEHRWRLAVDHPKVVKKWAIILSAAELAVLRIIKHAATLQLRRIPEALVEVRVLRRLIVRGIESER